jgi:hypothetical protein
MYRWDNIFCSEAVCRNFGGHALESMFFHSPVFHSFCECNGDVIVIFFFLLGNLELGLEIWLGFAGNRWVFEAIILSLNTASVLF